MNNTKWAVILAALEDLGLQYRIKWLDIDEPTRWGNVWLETPDHIEGSFGPPEPLLAIEWLEVCPSVRKHRARLLPDDVTDHTDEVERRLRAANVPFGHEEGRIRITRSAE